MKILGIESSCDETAASVVDMKCRKILSNVISSQHSVHRKYGGVVPELASREHLGNVIPVIQDALEEAKLTLDDIEGIAVTHGPGLSGCLLVGLTAAKTLAWRRDLPMIGVNHLEGHLLAAFLEHPDLDYPYLGLIVSGGHTALYVMEGPDQRRSLATTRDDAVGEAFDKVAKLLDLGYPGGPALDKAARAYFGENPVAMPKAVMKDGSHDFSYSGLKTAVLTRMKKEANSLNKAALAAGFQDAAVSSLIDKTLAFAKSAGLDRIVVGGGVAANSQLREDLTAQAQEQGLKVFLVSPVLCMDNAAMIAYAGGLRLMAGERSALDLAALPNLAF